MDQEIELKLDAGDSGFQRVLRTLKRHGFRAGDAVEVRQHDEYLDSADWWLYRAGVALRVRRTRGDVRLAMKSLAPPAAGIARRLEIEERLAGRAARAARLPRGRIRELLDTAGAPARLRPIFRITTTRRVVECRRRADRFLVSLDRSAVVVRSKRRISELGRFEEVEVEHAGGRPASGARLLDRLRRESAAPVSTQSKFERGLQAVGLAPAELPGSATLDVRATDRYGDVVYRILARHFDQIVAHTPGTRLGIDPEPLHDMRVAIRRLRTALRAFRHDLPPRARDLSQRWRAVARVLGAVRDCDVQLDVLEAQLSRRTRDLAWLDGERRRVQAVRAASRRRLLRMLDSGAYRRLVRRFRAFLDRRRPRRGSAAAHAGPVAAPASRLLGEAYARVMRRGRRAFKRRTARPLHALRIACKRLRYTAEWFQPLYGADLARLIRTLIRLQDVLGVHHDAVVALEQAEHPSLRRLHRRQLREANARFPKRWRRFAGVRFDASRI
jgi:CHAD domain-containing protein/uncharacterized protein YjbK